MVAKTFNAVKGIYLIKKKIILDCDPGHDDAVAIMLAAASSDIEILGITCVGGNATLENTQMNVTWGERPNLSHSREWQFSVSDRMIKYVERIQ